MKARWLSLLAPLCLGGCDTSLIQTQSAQPAATDAIGGTTANGAILQTFADLSLVRADGALPRNPTSALPQAYCEGYVVEPETKAGREVKASGWLVTSEVDLGTKVAISYAQVLTPGTSGLCFAEQGQIAIFAQDRLEYLVTRAPGTEVDISAGIGMLEAIPNSANVRIGDGGLGYALPLADLVVSGDAVTIERVAESDLVCAPDLRIPNIFNQPIAEAREDMISHGWEPVDHRTKDQEQSDWFWVVEMRDQGIVEVENCSGTGFALCNYSYTHPSGAMAGLTSYGELFHILGYGYSCSTK